MKTIIKAALATTAIASAFAAAPAFADDAKGPITITGSAALTSEYRLRGISQTDTDPAIQAGITITHESGLYIGTWGSNLSGIGSFGGDNLELDLIGGYSKAVGPVTLDGGVIYYVYPGTKGFDFAEIYGSVSGKVGPLNAKLGTYWAPDQKALAFSKPKGHNIWVYTDWGLPIAGTPVTLKAHGGYSSGTSGYTRGKDVFDYAVGADFTYKNLTLNLSYIGTDVSRTRSALWAGGNASGYSVVRGRLVGTLTAAF
jgi:uncharacterized protein (TIGR02001 family)